MAAARAVALPGFRAWYRKFVFNSSGYNKYGLLYDDLLHETEEVQEAIRRLPQKVQDERTYRILRASYLCTWQKILPQNEWTKINDDVRYLKPLVDEVKQENAERRAWDSK